MSAETKVDVSGLLRELPELLVIASTDPSSDRLIGVALRIRETESAVAELIEAAREVSADMRYLMGRASAEGHDSGQSLAQQTSAKIDAALARIGGAK